MDGVVSTFTANPGTLPAGYDTTSDFPSEPAGWGEPGIRHAEAIGHGVWLAEHLDDLSTDELIASARKASDDLDAAVAASRAARLFEPEPAKCPIPLCVRDDHPVFELCEDAVGHTWFQGEPHDTEGTGQ